MQRRTNSKMSNQIPATYTRIVLQERPKKGPITETTFRAEEGSTEELKTSLGDSDVLIRVDYVSLDPAMRGWLNDARSYVEPVAIGAVMRAAGLGTVVAVGKDVKSTKVGDLVHALAGSCRGPPPSKGSSYSDCFTGWTEYAVFHEKAVQVIT
jgi:NADPH-dependent curcumin reductase CurA